MRNLTRWMLVIGLGVIGLGVIGWQCAWSTPVRAEEPGQAAPTFDGRQYVDLALEEKVGEPRVIERQPLFDNFPFLQLRAGDKLLKGKRWIGFHKGGEGYFSKNESYFLKSGDKYYKLEVREPAGRHFASGQVPEQVPAQPTPLSLSGHHSLLFDWEFNLANATKLFAQSTGGPNEAITLKSLADLKAALQKDFPETVRDEEVQIDAPYIAGEGTKRRAIFQGLGFDRHRNTVFKFQFEIGNDTFIQYRKNLIVGPRRVERYEFEGDQGSSGINGRPPHTPNPEAAAKARVAYDRMMAFQTLVNTFLVTPRIEPKPGTGKGGFGS